MTEIANRLRVAALTALCLVTATACATEPVVSNPLAPHRATYTLSLAKSTQASGVGSAEGTMSYELADACSGWTVDQRYKLRVVYAESDDTSFNVSFVTWESKDKLRYRFNVRKIHEDEPDEILKGTAEVAAGNGAGEIKFLKPEAQTLPLTAESLFPTGHTEALLQAARDGRTFLSKPVFDGGTVEPAYLVTAAIGKPHAADPGEQNPLLQTRWWPVSMAFFSGDADSAQPDYELSMHLQENGIASSITIDYGQFVIHAQLKSLDPVPRPNC